MIKVTNPDRGGSGELWPHLSHTTVCLEANISLLFLLSFPCTIFSISLVLRNIRLEMSGRFLDQELGSFAHLLI